jgi:hypothetical protein
MDRRVLVRIEGDVAALLRAWQAPATAEIKRKQGHVDVLLSSPAMLAELESLKAAVRVLPPGAVEVVPFFQAWDFTASDFEAASAVTLRVFGGPALAVEPLADETACGTCGETHWVVRPLDRVTASARGPVAGTFLDAGDSAVLAHRDFIRSLRAAGLDRGLATTPAVIESGTTTSEEYAWIRGTLDLGYFTGRVLYGPPCPECGQPTLLDNENFLPTFAPPAEPFDFAHSSVDGPLRLVISQLVYRHIVHTIPDRSTLVIEPIEFAAHATVGRVH